MVEVDDVVPRLVDAARSIGPVWQRHLDDWEGESAGPYNDVAVIARHLVNLLARGQSEEVAAVFATVEQMLRGDLSVDARTLLVVGLLEDVQNITSHDNAPVGSAAFGPLLGPVTLLAWIDLHGAWGTEDT